jgi:type II secretory pathway component GspD/PulD (secretin)
VEIRVFPLQHCDPTDVADEISTLFPAPETQGNQANNARGLGVQFVGNRAAAAAEQSERMKKQTTVIAVADARTQSVLVTASKETMKVIANMVADLESNPANMIQVYVYQPQHADVADLEGPLRDLFASTTQVTSTSEVNALLSRANQAAQNAGILPSSVTSSSLGGGGGGATSAGGK